MLNKKLFTAVAILASAFSGITLAETYNITGTVAAINTIAIADNSTDLADLGTTTNSNVGVAAITISNNDPDGFKLSFSSGNGGTLKLTHTSAVDSIAYTISLTDSGSSTDDLASINGSLPSGQALGTVPTDVIFDGTVNQASVDRIFTLQVSTTADNTLLAGSYTDTITVTLTDL